MVGYQDSRGCAVRVNTGLFVIVLFFSSMYSEYFPYFPHIFVIQAAIKVHSEGRAGAVFFVPAGSDSRAIKQITEGIKAVSYCYCYCCVLHY